MERLKHHQKRRSTLANFEDDSQYHSGRRSSIKQFFERQKSMTPQAANKNFLRQTPSTLLDDDNEDFMQNQRRTRRLSAMNLKTLIFGGSILHNKNLEKLRKDSGSMRRSSLVDVRSSIVAPKIQLSVENLTNDMAETSTSFFDTSPLDQTFSDEAQSPTLEDDSPRRASTLLPLCSPNSRTKRKQFFGKFRLKSTSSSTTDRLTSNTQHSGEQSPATLSLDGGIAHKLHRDSSNIDDDEEKFFCVRTLMQNCLNLTTTAPGMGSIRRRAAYSRRGRCRMNSDGGLVAQSTTPTGCGLSLLVAEAKDSIFRKRSEPILRMEPKDDVLVGEEKVHDKPLFKKTIHSTFLQGINFLRRHSTDKIPPITLKKDKLYQDVTLRDLESWSQNLQNLLHNKIGIELFKQFLKREFSQENLEFYLQCCKYKSLFDNLDQSPQNMLKQQSFVSLANQMYEDYISEFAVKEVNLDPHTRRAIFDQLLMPNRNLFDVAQRKIFNLMEKDTYPRFLRSDLYTNLRNILANVENSSNNC